MREQHVAPFFFLSMTNALISYLERFISKKRKELFDSVLTYRTRYITVVLEDIFQSQNASAVLRTCDCFGIQDIHIIEDRNEFRINPDVTLGSDKWLTLKKYKSCKNNTLKAINTLKKKGYRIVATTPHQDNTELKDFNLSAGKAALFFGTELQGLSSDILQNADEYLKIPMFGFTESFNISVSIAIILNELVTKLHTSTIEWQLPEKDKMEVKQAWLKKSIKKSDLIEKEFYQNHIQNQKNK